MRAKVILVLTATAAALLSAVYAGGEAMARGSGGGRGGHGGMMSSSRGMHGMNRHMQHFPFKGQRAHAMHDKHHDGKGNHGKSGNMQGAWRTGNQRNNNFQGQWIAGGGGGGGGGSVGDICLNSGVCQGVWQTAPQSDTPTSQSRSLQRSWHAGDQM